MSVSSNESDRQTYNSESEEEGNIPETEQEVQHRSMTGAAGSKAKKRENLIEMRNIN